jgi:hypothetical protein
LLSLPQAFSLLDMQALRVCQRSGVEGRRPRRCRRLRWGKYAHHAVSTSNNAASSHSARANRTTFRFSTLAALTWLAANGEPTLTNSTQFCTTCPSSFAKNSLSTRAGRSPRKVSTPP